MTSFTGRFGPHAVTGRIEPFRPARESATPDGRVFVEPGETGYEGEMRCDAPGRLTPGEAGWLEIHVTPREICRVFVVVEGVGKGGVARFRSVEGTP